MKSMKMLIRSPIHDKTKKCSFDLTWIDDYEKNRAQCFHADPIYYVGKYYPNIVIENPYKYNIHELEKYVETKKEAFT